MRNWFILAMTAACQLLSVNVSHAGGMSAGGGNFLHTIAPERPGQPEVAESAIRQAHGQLRDYLLNKKRAWQERRLPPAQNEAFQALFSSPTDVFPILATRSLNIEEQSACLDARGQQVDGSVYANGSPQGTGPICVSSWTLSRKTIVSDYYAQSVALLSHEFSELAGLSEDEAVRLQEQVLIDLRGSIGGSVFDQP